MPSSYPLPTKMVVTLFDRGTSYLMRSYPIKESPLNLRPGMLFVTAGWIILLGILGMAPLPEIPLNDKALHFFGMGFATFLVYFIIEVPEGPARRVWYIRRAPLLCTLITSFFFGGIVSEFVQATLPWKEFQFGDIIANLSGATLFLYLAHVLHTRSRKRAELSSLYQPLSNTNTSTYRDARGREHAFSQSPTQSQTRGPYGFRNGHGRQGSNVWDEESEAARSDEQLPIGRERDPALAATAIPAFHLGDSDDDDEGQVEGGKHKLDRGEQLV